MTFLNKSRFPLKNHNQPLCCLQKFWADGIIRLAQKRISHSAKEGIEWQEMPPP